MWMPVTLSGFGICKHSGTVTVKVRLAQMLRQSRCGLACRMVHGACAQFVSRHVRRGLNTMAAVEVEVHSFIGQQCLEPTCMPCKAQLLAAGVVFWLLNMPECVWRMHRPWWKKVAWHVCAFVS